MANNVDHDDIIFDPLPAEDGWTTQSKLPTAWRACHCCHHVFDPYHSDRLLVAFTEEMEEVVQFTNSVGANTFLAVVESKRKPMKPSDQWRWMNGLRWDSAMCNRPDTPRDLDQIAKVKSIIDRHQQHLPPPQRIIRTGGKIPISPNDLQESPSKPRSPQPANMRTRRQGVRKTSFPFQYNANLRSKSTPGLTKSSKKKKRIVKATVLTSNVSAKRAKTHEARGGEERPENANFVQQAQRNDMETADPATKEALDAMWTTVRQIASDNPSMMKETLSVAMEMHLSYLKR